MDQPKVRKFSWPFLIANIKKKETRNNKSFKKSKPDLVCYDNYAYGNISNGNKEKCAKFGNETCLCD